MMKRIAALAVAGFLTLGMTSMSASADEAVPGDSPSNPIVVADPSEVPEGAIEDEVSTYSTPQACDTTRSWVLTIPANEETSHQEFRYLTVVPGQYHEAVTHEEFKYERTVVDYVTEYHFRKFTRERTRTYTPGTEAVYSTGIWANWAPSNTHGPQDYTPFWPEDSERGKWIVHEQGVPPGHEGPDGVYQQGGGNSPFFYREAPKVITPATEGGYGPWSEYGPWTAWEPMTHESWETSDAPLGVPQFHSEGYTGNTHWQRQWQAQFDGQTREVENGSNTETTEWLTGPPEGEGWEQIAQRTVIDSAAYTDPDVTLYYVLGGEPSTTEADASWLLAEQAPGEGWTVFDERTVQNGDGTPEVVTYYAYTDGAECEKPEGYENSTSDEKCVDGNLVTTATTTTGTPVQAEDGSWTIEETATSSQSVEQDAAQCAPKPEEPENPDTPSEVLNELPMTGQDPSTTVLTPAGQSPLALYGGMAALLAGLAGLMLALRRRSA